MWQSKLITQLGKRSWLSLVSRETLRKDLEASIVCVLITVPQGIAFAELAGMPPIYGLYSAIVPALIAALLGSSHHMVSGPTTAASILLLSSLSEFAEPGSADYIALALTATFFVGLLQLTLGALKLGVLANFVSHGSLMGFTAGAALLIAMKQMPTFMEQSSSSLVTGQNLPVFSPSALVIGFSTLFTYILTKRLLPKIPPMLTALAGGVLSGYIITQIAPAFGGPVIFMAAVEPTLPPFEIIGFSSQQVLDLSHTILALSLLAMVESISISRSIALSSKQRINANQEFMAQGVSNMVGSMFSSYVAAGSFNRSALNYQAGAQTPMAAIFCALLLLVMFPVLTKMIVFIPTAAVATTLLIVAWRIANFRRLWTLIRNTYVGAFLAIGTFIATLLFGLDVAILLGTVMGLLVHIYRTSRPSVRVMKLAIRDGEKRFRAKPDGEECPQIRTLRVDGSLFFGAISHVEDAFYRIRNNTPELRSIAILADGINFLDMAGAEFLVQEAMKQRQIGGDLYLCGFKEESFPRLVKSLGYIDRLGSDHIFERKSEMVSSMLKHVDHSICKQCKKRVFEECKSLPGSEDENR